METILRSLGLTNREIDIYKLLLEQGPSKAGNIAQRTGIHRRNTYDCLARLISKGMVSYIEENNTKTYTLTNPETIAEKLKQQEQEYNKLLPEIVAKFNARHAKRQTLFFHGKQGLRLIFEDQIKEKQEILVNATTTNVYTVLKYFFPKYNLLRKENKIKTRMIFDQSYKKDKKTTQKLNQIPLCRTRFIKNFNKSPMSQYIYGDNVAIIVWSETPVAILIRQKEIAQGFRDSFEVMWKIATQ